MNPLSVVTLLSLSSDAALADSFVMVAETDEGCMLYLDGTNLVSRGCNVHIESGSGATDDDGSLTGLGNLIVGYNEATSDTTKTGSHNLIVGEHHSYTSYGGLVAGYENTVTAPSASIIGGAFNTVSGQQSVVSGGSNNTVAGTAASISGGAFNAIIGYGASISGGAYNSALGSYASVSGGYYNAADGSASSILGGRQNQTSGYWVYDTDLAAFAAGGATISGGLENAANGEYASVSGGYYNTADGDASSILGGRENQTFGTISYYTRYGAFYHGAASISGGLRNDASGDSASVVGGSDNHAIGGNTTVSGTGNHATISSSTISDGSRLQTNLPLAAGVTNYGSGYQVARYAIEDGVTVLSGLVRKSGGWSPGDLIGTLPGHACPGATLIFAVNTHNSDTGRVNINFRCEIIWNGGTASHDWISLSGISFRHR
ncbi:MAG: hypothetical protein AAFV53_06445 [Myxococcota bacterium]